MVNYSTYARTNKGIPYLTCDNTIWIWHCASRAAARALIYAFLVVDFRDVVSSANMHTHIVLIVQQCEMMIDGN